MKKIIWLVICTLVFSIMVGCTNQEEKQKELEKVKRAKMSPEEVIEQMYEAAKADDFDTFKSYMDIDRMTVITGLYENDLDKKLKKDMKTLASHASSVHSYKDLSFTKLNKNDFGQSLLESKPIGQTMVMLEDLPLIAEHYKVTATEAGYTGFIPFVNEYGNDVMKEALQKEEFQQDTFLQIALLRMKEDGSFQKAIETFYTQEELQAYNEAKADLLTQIEQQKQLLVSQYQGENSLESLGKDISIYLENYISTFEKPLKHPTDVNPQLFLISKKEEGYFISSYESIIIR